MSEEIRVVIFIESVFIPLSLMLVLLAVLTDVRVNRIPNIILIFLIILQIVSATFFYSTFDGIQILFDLGKRCLTVFLIFLFLFIFFSIGGLGAGDIKLLCVLAIGLDRPIEFIAVAFLLAAVISVFFMIFKGNLIQRLFALRNYIGQIIQTGRLLPYFSEKPHIEEKLNYSIHLSIPIFIAYCIVLVIRNRAV